jgi:SnoaL-like domain
LSEIDELRTTVEELKDRVRFLEDQVELGQLVARYGPSVDSGSAEATAELWTDDGVFDAVGAIRMQGHDEIAAMVTSDGHQRLIKNGCGRVLTAPLIAIDGDQAEGRNYALNIRWDPEHDRFWVARVSANTWRWVRTPAGWRTTERTNANLNGTPEHRRMLTPPDRRPRTH